MMRRLLTGVNFTCLALWVSSALAQGVNLGEARQTVLDISTHHLSTLESVVTKVPPHAQDKIAEAIEANETSRINALSALSRAQNGYIPAEEGVAQAYDAVEQGTRKHTEVLAGLLDKVPEEALPAIERALEVSQTGRNTALANLSAIQQGERPPGASIGTRPETTIGQPGTLSRPESPGLGTSVGQPSTLPRQGGTGIFTGSGRQVDPPYGGSSGGFGRPSVPGGAGGSFGGPSGIIGGGGPGGVPGGGRPGR